MFKKILIANRGEIACRIIQTARKMGIATVAVYSDADRNARHVEMADEAIRIGPAPSQQSYLCIDEIIAACKRTGAQAVHPGYGFLAENEHFCTRLEAAGIVFIGPKAASIAAMGDKIASKKLAQAAGVSIIPGHNEAIASAGAAVAIARTIGYPVMIKASAGGGGKGLRVAYDDEQCNEGFDSCRNEARNAFGDDRVFIEKYVEEPRHIEIQILGDAHGNTVYLWERECSIQRRHQKVIEEAPSPFLDDATRAAMGAQAVSLARAVNYQSAGTVEFVVGKDKSFYFLEMNTRLQVEHPVTEMITGLDLVEQMIRVAAGEKLAFAQRDIVRNGWAMECRINAEDPHRGFLPSSGRLVVYIPPHEKVGQVRVDTGVCEGGEIPIFYDSMIAKLIVHGKDRLQCIERMRAALDAFVIRGVQSNVAFQAALMRHPRFVSGQFNTGFIAEEYPHGFAGAERDAQLTQRFIAVAAGLHAMDEMLERRSHSRVQLGREAMFEALLADETYKVRISCQEDRMLLAIDEVEHTLCLHWLAGRVLLRAQFDGATFDVQIQQQAYRYLLNGQGVSAAVLVLPPRVAQLKRRMPKKMPPDTGKHLRSPMPGLLTQIVVAVGQTIKAGEKLAVIEAMKMENILRADHDGTIAAVVAKTGESLSVDQVILEFE